MKPRITINLNKDGELETWLHEAWRDLPVRDLQHLSERSNHFHLGPKEFDGEVPFKLEPTGQGHVPRGRTGRPVLSARA